MFIILLPLQYKHLLQVFVYCLHVLFVSQWENTSVLNTCTGLYLGRGSPTFALGRISSVWWYFLFRLRSDLLQLMILCQKAVAQRGRRLLVKELERNVIGEKESSFAIWQTNVSFPVSITAAGNCLCLKLCGWMYSTSLITFSFGNLTFMSEWEFPLLKYISFLNQDASITVVAQIYLQKKTALYLHTFHSYWSYHWKILLCAELSHDFAGTVKVQLCLGNVNNMYSLT